MTDAKIVWIERDLDHMQFVLEVEDKGREGDIRYHGE